ncbi:MAG: BamA/TamA family outer membrane protein [Taibaiella sp.]|jgi:outer membrane protein assembly factor BamA
MFRYLYYFLLLVIVCNCPSQVNAQQAVLILHPVDTSDTKQTLVLDKKPLPLRQQFDNIADANSYVRKLVSRFQEQGYMAASADSIAMSDSAVHAWIYQGAVYQWAKLSFDKVPTALLNDMNISSRDWEQQVISPSRYASLSERMLKYCEDNGYPFAQVTLDQIERNDKGLSANLVLDRGNLVYFDSLIIESDAEISRDFLQNYLGIRQGSLYNESQLRLVSKRLSELAFLQEARPWQMEFTIGQNKLKLFLKEKKANQLNGLIGLQPNTVETGKFMLTADILLGLKNVLGYGESIAATYQSLQYKSPRFHAELAVPYLFGTPFGAEGSFDLFKRDSLFVRVTFDVGIKYQLNATDYFKVLYQTYSNRLNYIDVNYVKANKKLPENLDISNKGALVEFYMDRTDYKLNPHKGWQVKVSGAGLLRNVKPNDAITGISDGSGFDYTKLYDSLSTDKYQYRINGAINYYISPFRNMVIMAGYSGGYISGSNLFLNELFQLGGFKLLRGFDEQSIYANQYHVGTLELRLLLSRNSYFYIFSDNAFTEARYAGIYRKDYPVSFGGGITLENKSGIFNVALGLGKHSGEGFQFKQAKIHFGYTAYF